MVSCLSFAGPLFLHLLPSIIPTRGQHFCAISLAGILGPGRCLVEQRGAAADKSSAADVNWEQLLRT